MKKIRIFTSLVMAFFTLTNFAQPTDCTSDRYQKRVFNNISVTSDLTYGSAQNVAGFTQSLELDFYEPAANEEYLTKRPLVVMFFGGAYVLGSKDAADMVAWCDSLAHYGYACASIEYRLDNIFNFALPSQGVRAAYRAVQDGRAAIRYLLEDPNGLGFNIDRDRIYTGGNSAGSITAIHIAYADNSERPADTFNNPDLGCIDCSGNTYNQPFDIKGVIDLWGAVLDPTFIDAAENIPMVIIHGDQDNVIPFDTGPPFNVPLFPTMYGAVPMAAQLTANNTCYRFFPYAGEDHTFYGSPSGVVTFPNQYWAPIFIQGHEFLYEKTLQFDSPVPVGALTFCDGSTETYQVPATPGSIYCWSVSNGMIINSNNNQVTVNWNNSPGTLTVTETNCIDVVGNPQSINVMPTTCCSPVNLAIQFDSFPAQSSWDIVDANGNMVVSGGTYNGLPTNSSIAESACLPNGCYTLNFYDVLGNGMCPFQSSAVGISTFITPGTLITPGSIVGTLSLVATPGLCGNYTLSDAAGNSLVTGGGNFGSLQSQTFCINGNSLVPRINHTNGIHKSGLTFDVYPTVTNNYVFVNYKADHNALAQIRLIDMQGKMLQQFYVDNYNASLPIDLSDFANGVYLVQLMEQDRVLANRKIVKH